MVTYDSLLWGDMTDRLSEGDRRLNPSTNMTSMVTKIESEAVKKTKQKKHPMDSGPAQKQSASSEKWCSVCQTSKHDGTECKKIHCQTCKKYGFCRTPDCYYNKKNDSRKGKDDKGKGSRPKGKGK